MLITNEDNMELMARYEDNHFDLAIVDPPYGIDINSSGRLGHYGGKGKSGITKYQQIIILKNFSGFQRIKLFGAQTISICHQQDVF